MAVYDCFAFFNELDLLELRMAELDPVVDYFVLAEATRTFQKQPKPLYFQENRARFSKYEKKIIYVLVDKYPTFWTKFRPVTGWHYGNHQKEQTLQGVKNASPKDHIIYSDLDEVPSAESIQRALQSQKKFQVFEHNQAIYFLNNVCRKINDFGGKAIAQHNQDGFGWWRGSVMTQKENIKNIKNLRMTRDSEGEDIEVIRRAGWHLSFMGGIESIIYKLKSYEHTEYSGEDYTSREVVEKAIREGTDLLKSGEKYELASLEDKTIPFLSALKAQPEKWRHMMMIK